MSWLILFFRIIHGYITTKPQSGLLRIQSAIIFIFKISVWEGKYRIFKRPLHILKFNINSRNCRIGMRFGQNASHDEKFS